MAKPVGAKVVWGLRASRVEILLYDYTRRAMCRLESALARFADLIICNSGAGLAHLAERGFPMSGVMVVPNGIDTERFSPNPILGRQFRAKWGVFREHYLVGLVARIDPMKGHADFLAAADLVRRRYADARFVVVGDGPDEQRRELRNMARELCLNDEVIWSGERLDIPAVLAALDLSVSASRLGEGCSNVLAESMACGVPCVATDVGDAAKIIGDFGWIVKPCDSVALAEGISTARDAHRAGVFNMCGARERIEREFSVNQLAERTASALISLGNASR